VFIILQYIFLCNLFPNLVINYMIILLLLLQRVCVLTVCSTLYLEKIVVLGYIGRTYIIMYFSVVFTV